MEQMHLDASWAGDAPEGASPRDPEDGAGRDIRWRQGFHLMPATGWLNDPNGLCQFRGAYHVFHQYSPDWPAPDAPRGWGHFVSDDLVHWRNLGPAIMPELAEEASGSYSGSAVVLPGAASDGGDALRLYYTGNVKHPGSYDYIHAGRDANEIIVETEDGVHLGEKRVFMTNADYPSFCSRHVRDPKVWRDGGSWWMLLGARDRSDRGMALRYRSDDGVSWTFDGVVCSAQPFGYMWECPDRIALGSREYIAFCPQGMQGFVWSNGMRDQAGYIPLDPGVAATRAGTLNARHFRRWDCGFDFYAPQTFTDDQGRVLLIGWMGVPEAPFSSAPDNLSWCHCLTVPRVLAQAPGGAIAQRPVPELAELRGEALGLSNDAAALELSAHRADVELTGFSAGRLSLDGGAVTITVADDALHLAFDRSEQSLGGAGAGRVARMAPLGAGPHALRVLIDASSIEVFADDGTTVMSTRWFPRARALTLSWASDAGEAVAWELSDAMDGTY